VDPTTRVNRHARRWIPIWFARWWPACRNLEREVALLRKKAQDWNAEADKYLAQRGDVEREVARLKGPQGETVSYKMGHGDGQD
jgi:hypothetical protein